METAIVFLYYIAASALYCLLLGIFVFIGLSFAVRAAVNAQYGYEGSGPYLLPQLIKWLLLGLLFGVAGITVLGLIGIIFPHAIDGPLIYRYGQRADAKVLDRVATNNSFNDQRVDRYNVIFRTESGQTIETYFETWDFNIYPSANTVTYPAPGQTFRVAYLPSYPKAFLILTGEKSEYQSSRACTDALKNIEQKRNKYEFDKNDTKFRSEYMTALAEGIQKGCGDNLMDELRSLGASNAK